MSGYFELSDAEKRLFKWFDVSVIVRKTIKYQPGKNGAVQGIESVSYTDDDDNDELYFTHPYLTAKSPQVIDRWTVDMDNFCYKVDPELMDILKDLIEEIKECDKKLREEYEKNGTD